MDWLNYHHLYYFYVVAREGSIVKACEKIGVAQPTISGQVHELERHLGQQLFSKVGRRLALTEMGRVVYRYADEIFSLGQELTDTVTGRSTVRTARFQIGIADVVPMQIAYRILQPLFKLAEPMHLVCREDRAERLMADLSLNELDLVISDTPLSPTTKTRAFDYLLGESTVSILGTAELKEKLSGKFPESLDGAPMVFPGGASTLRRSLDRWCDQKKLFPAVVAEVQDSGLRNIMAQSGIGLVPVPGLVDDEVASRYSLVKIGEISDITEQFYAMAADRRIQHPGVQAVAENSQKRLVSAI